MKKHINALALILVVAILVFCFSACAKKEGAVDKIKAKGELTMLTNAAFPPFEYLGDDNKPAGVDIEIAQAIADDLGVALKVVDMDFDGIIAAIQSGQGDLGVAGITNTEERQKSVNFSIDYISTTQKIVVTNDSTINAAADLTGKTIGVQMGTTGDLFASEYVEDATIMRYKTGPDAGLALQGGQIDAIVIDAMPAEQIASSGDNLKLLDEPLTEEKYAIAISKENEDLKAAVDKVLQNLLDDGTIDALVAKHLELSK